MVEMTTAEQRRYDDRTGHRLATLTPHMPCGRTRQVWIVEGGYCADTRYEEKLQDKEAQHQELHAALTDVGYNVATLPIILGFSGSNYHATTDALAQLGIEHKQAEKVMLKVHEHAKISLQSIIMSRRALEGKREGKQKQFRTGFP